MNVLNRLVLAAALTTAWPIGSVLASDLITVPAGPLLEMPVHEEPGFAWSGFYAGIYGLAQGDALGIGAQIGVNAQFEFFLIGAEVAVHGMAGADIGNTSYGEILGRAGLIVSDNVLVYAAGGYGIDLGPATASDALLGAGVELALTKQLSVEAQYLHGFPLEGGDGTDQVTLGANFHF